MTVHFDYTPYAAAYSGRPDYVPHVLSSVLRTAGVRPGDRVCDIGAGSGHLTEPLAAFGLTVDAVEPNAAMGDLGRRRTAPYPAVTWYEGVGEDTGLADGGYHLVTFGSSFDRTDRPAALREAARILRPGGHVVCLWNHRSLDDPLQRRIEALIKAEVAGYGYGVRRTDQRAVIEDSGLFAPPVHISGRQVFRVGSGPWCDAWASHATLGEQAGDRFGEIVDRIRALVDAECGEWIEVPYETRAWIARRAPGAGQ